jgi:hypothetical protein
LPLGTKGENEELIIKYSLADKCLVDPIIWPTVDWASFFSAVHVGQMSVDQMSIQIPLKTWPRQLLD